jgi:hypothetical protein
MAFDYASRNFDTIKRDLLARADRVFPEWSDRDPSDFGMLFVDLWSHMGDVLHYYVDRAAGEAFLNTAQQRESVLAYANLFDYTPRGRTSPVATATLANTTATDYVVPANTKFIARYDNVTYQCYTENGGTIGATSTGIVTLKEGNLFVDESLTTGASGLNNQRYSLINDNVVPNSCKVYVYEDGITATEYLRISRITQADTGERVFVTNTTADGVTEILFGSNLNGYVPPPGATIKCTYADSSGYAGNLPANSVPAAGWASATPTGLTVQSCTSFSGGLYAESITALKASIPSVISAQNRAVTKNDYIRLAQQLDSVSKAAVSYVPGIGGGGSATNASVTIYAQTERADYLDPTLVDTSQTVSAAIKADVVSSLQPKAMLGVDVIAASTITWTPIDLDMTVYVNERYVTNWVEADVGTAIDELFDFDNVFFGQRIHLGQLYRIALNVPGVDYVEVTVFDESGGSAVESSILVDELALPKRGDITLTMVGGISTT